MRRDSFNHFARSHDLDRLRAPNLLGVATIASEQSLVDLYVDYTLDRTLCLLLARNYVLPAVRCISGPSSLELDATAIGLALCDKHELRADVQRHSVAARHRRLPLAVATHCDQHARQAT